MTAELDVRHRSTFVTKRALTAAADEARIELRARRAEERSQAVEADPLVARLYLLAQDYGPVAMQTVRALDHWHVRHARRWRDEELAA